MEKRIYIAVSGCKNGFSVFYTSPGFDAAYPGMSASLCDMRLYLRVSKPGIDYYGLDFVEGFRVCSKYRSTIDSAGSSGGYISVALVIPDNMQPADTAGLLDSLLDSYYSEYYNRQFSTPLSGKPEDGRALESLLASASGSVRTMPVHYHPGVSDFAAPPVYMGADAAVVRQIFSNPYQTAYLGGCKLVMLPGAIMTQPQAYGVVFNTDVKQTRPSAEGVSDRMSGRMSGLVQQGCHLDSFVLNGADVTPLMGQICLKPSDRISFAVTLPNGRRSTFEGSVMKALEEKVLLSVRDIYGFNFFPFDVAVAVRGLMPGYGRGNILMPSVVTAKGVWPISVNTRGEGYFTVKAPFTTAALALVPEEGMPVVIDNAFLSQNSDLRRVYGLELRPIDIKYPPRASGKAAIEIESGSFPVELSHSPLRMLIPAALRSSMTLKMNKNRWKINAVTGMCTSTGGAREFRFPMKWIWVIAGVVLLLAGGLVWYLLSPGTKPKVAAEASGTVKTDSVKGRKDSIRADEEFTHGLNPDGTPVDDPSVRKKEAPDRAKLKKGKEEIHEALEEMKEEREEEEVSKPGQGDKPLPGNPLPHRKKGKVIPGNAPQGKKTQGK